MEWLESWRHTMSTQQVMDPPGSQWPSGLSWMIILCLSRSQLQLGRFSLLLGYLGIQPRYNVLIFYITGWWFQIFFIFTPIWGNDPIWLIFFRWVETTNQIRLSTLEAWLVLWVMFISRFQVDGTPLHSTDGTNCELFYRTPGSNVEPQINGLIKLSVSKWGYYHPISFHFSNVNLLSFVDRNGLTFYHLWFHPAKKNGRKTHLRGVDLRHPKHLLLSTHLGFV